MIATYPYICVYIYIYIAKATDGKVIAVLLIIVMVTIVANVTIVELVVMEIVTRW